MKKFCSHIKISCAWLFCSIAFAENSLQLPVYYQASCASYAGTWRGFMTNPSDLQAPATRAVTLQLGVKNNLIYGQMNQQLFWAQCQNGRLANIFVGSANQCGRYSQQGALIGKDALAIEIDQQNAMMDWTWWLFLKRVSAQTHFNAPTNFNFPKPISCH